MITELKSKLIKITGLWTTESRKGKKYLKAKLKDGSRIIVMPNKDKKGPNSPAWDLLIEPPPGTPDDVEVEILFKPKVQAASVQASSEDEKFFDGSEDDDVFADLNLDDIPL